VLDKRAQEQPVDRKTSASAAEQIILEPDAGTVGFARR
jgi:hypothetical protein